MFVIIFILSYFMVIKDSFFWYLVKKKIIKKNVFCISGFNIKFLNY